MIDPLSPKKIEPIRLSPDQLADRQLSGTSVTAQRGVEVDRAETRLLDLSASIAVKGPPVDQQKVAELRAALADGSYAIQPRQLAAALLGFGAGTDDGR